MAPMNLLDIPFDVFQTEIIPRLTFTAWHVIASTSHQLREYAKNSPYKCRTIVKTSVNKTKIEVPMFSNIFGCKPFTSFADVVRLDPTYQLSYLLTYALDIDDLFLFKLYMRIVPIMYAFYGSSSFPFITTSKTIMTYFFTTFWNERKHIIYSSNRTFDRSFVYSLLFEQALPTCIQRLFYPNTRTVGGFYQEVCEDLTKFTEKTRFTDNDETRKGTVMEYADLLINIYIGRTTVEEHREEIEKLKNLVQTRLDQFYLETIAKTLPPNKIDQIMKILTE